MADNFFKVRNGLSLGSLPSAPANPDNGDIYYDTGLEQFQKYENGAWSALGSGSGAQNYISNPTFDANASDYAAYADAASSRPVDGTGGSPTVTITRTTSSPLHGAGSGLITKDAANRQGEGVSTDITIDNGDQAKTMVISFDYQIASGTFQAGDDVSQTDSDIIVYVYRTTATGRTIEPIGFRLKGSVVGVNYTHKAYFATDADATGYRIIFHVATTSASAFTLKFDNLSVAPQVINYAPIVTDWQSYTPVITGRTSDPTRPSTVDFEKMLWRRVGSSIELQYEYYAASLAGAAAGTGVYDYSLPPGYRIDPNLVNISTNSNEASGLGTASWYSASQSRNFDGMCTASSATTIALNAGADGFTAQDQSNAFGPLTDTTAIRVSALIPIVGLTANAVAPEQAEPRLVAASYGSTSTAAASPSTPIVYNVLNYDTHNSLDPTTGVFTAPVAGIYSFVAEAFSGTNFLIRAHKNGTFIKQGTAATGSIQGTIAGSVYLAAGDTLDIRPDATPTMSNIVEIAYFDVQREAEPAVIPASEEIRARYVQTSGQVITLNTATTITYDTKDQDSHAAYNTSNGRFTAPRAGWYHVDACSELNAPNTLTGVMRISKNGASTPVAYGTLSGSQSSVNGSTMITSVSGGIYLNSGDTLEVQLWYNDGTSNRALTSNTGVNVISIYSKG